MTDHSIRSVRAYAPCRIDLAGGTLDIPPIYLFLPEACTVNLAISIGVEVTAERLEGSTSRIILLDRHLEFTLSVHGPSSIPRGGELAANILSHFHDLGLGAVLVKVHSESPIGAGLAASSALCVAMTSALARMSGMDLSLPELVRLCLDLEARILGTPAGYQDFFAAAGGGLQALRFLPGNIESERLKTDLDELSERMMLVYTGRPHHSGLSNWRVFKSFIDGVKKTRSALAEIGYIAVQMAAAVRSGDWPAVGSLLDKEWQQRRRLSTEISTKTVDMLIEAAAGVGGTGKVCGAGGGGCVVLWHDGSKESRRTLAGAVDETGSLILPWKPVEKGCQVTELP